MDSPDTGLCRNQTGDAFVFTELACPSIKAQLLEGCNPRRVVVEASNRGKLLATRINKILMPFTPDFSSSLKKI
jgi:hypothetical protein